MAEILSVWSLSNFRAIMACGRLCGDVIALMDATSRQTQARSKKHLKNQLFVVPISSAYQQQDDALFATVLCMCLGRVGRGSVEPRSSGIKPSGATKFRPNRFR
jgi:hypothetical protein